MEQGLERKKKWRFRFKALCGLIIIFAIIYGFHRWRLFQYENELQTLLAQIDADDPGWRWGAINANPPAIPDNENAAKRLLGVSELVGMNRMKGLSQWFMTYPTIQQKCDSSFE